MIKIGRDATNIIVPHSFRRDIDALDAFNNRIADPDKELQEILYPEPYAGNAHAMVYLLDRNPEFIDPDDINLMIQNGSDWDDMMRNSYDPIPSPGHQPTMYWLDPDCQNKIKPLPNGYDGGFTRWQQQTQPLQRYVPHIQDRLFYVAYHPYHSKKPHINEIIDNLPSCQDVNKLIIDAFQDPERIFVIARCKTAWYNRLSACLGLSIPELKATHRFIELNCSQSVPIPQDPTENGLDSWKHPWIDRPCRNCIEGTKERPWMERPWMDCPWMDYPWMDCPWHNSCHWRIVLQKLQSNPHPFKTGFEGL